MLGGAALGSPRYLVEFRFVQQGEDCGRQGSVAQGRLGTRPIRLACERSQQIHSIASLLMDVDQVGVGFAEDNRDRLKLTFLTRHPLAPLR